MYSWSHGWRVPERCVPTMEGRLALEMEGEVGRDCGDRRSGILDTICLCVRLDEWHSRFWDDFFLCLKIQGIYEHCHNVQGYPVQWQFITASIEINCYKFDSYDDHITLFSLFWNRPVFNLSLCSISHLMLYVLLGIFLNLGHTYNHTFKSSIYSFATFRNFSKVIRNSIHLWVLLSSLLHFG